MSAKARVAKLELAIQEAEQEAEGLDDEAQESARRAVLAALTDEELELLAREIEGGVPGPASERAKALSDIELARIIMEGRT